MDPFSPHTHTHPLACSCLVLHPPPPPPHPHNTQVEAATGVPCDKQRYWVWHKRQNKTYRPTSRLKAAEEAQAVVDLKEYRVVEEKVRGVIFVVISVLCLC